MSKLETQPKTQGRADNVAAVPPGYKRSEAGVIPEDWDTITFQDAFHFLGAANNSRADLNSRGEVAYIHYGDLHTKWRTILFCDRQELPRISKVRVQGVPRLREGDLIMADASEDCEGIGVAVEARGVGAQEIVAGLHTFLLRDRGDNFTHGFRGLIQYFPAVREGLNKIATGVSVYGISRGALARIGIPKPPLPEQRAIAVTLSDVDGLIGALDKLIVKKRAVKQAAIQQLLTGKTRLPGFEHRSGCKQTEVGAIPVDWQLKPLRKISSMNGRIGWQGLKQSEFTTNPDDPFLITGMNFRDGGIDWDEAYHVSEERYAVAPQIQLSCGDVLMTKDGTIGKLLYVRDIPYPGTATLNSHLLVFRPIANAFVPQFLFYQLSSRRFADHVELSKSGSTFFGISQQATGNFNAVLPPIPEQQAIATVLSDMETEIGALERRRGKTKAIKQGMMQALLAGRVRLIDPEAKG